MSYGYGSAKLLKYVENANSHRTGYLYDSQNLGNITPSRANNG